MKPGATTRAGAACALQTWWRSGWQKCASKATDGRFCAAHAWASTFPPFWNGGSVMGGSLIHRIAEKPPTPQASKEK